MFKLFFSNEIHYDSLPRMGSVECIQEREVDRIQFQAKNTFVQDYVIKVLSG